MYTLPSEPQSIGRTLDSGIKLFLGSFKSVIGLSVLASLLLLIPQTAMVFLSDPASGVFNTETSFSTMLGISIAALYLILILVYLPIWVAICSKIWAFANDQGFVFGAAFWRGVKLIPRVILMGLCYVLALIGGFLLLIIPGIYLTLSLSLSYYLVIVDDLKAVQSLKTSHKLIKGHWWRTLAVVSVPIFIMIALYVLAGILIGVYMGVSGAMNSPEAFDPMVNHIANMISSIVSAVFTPLLLSIALVILHDLKLRSQGSDLMDKLQAMKNNA